MSRPTIHDVAREAGVSLATIDRVLNQRPGVRTATIQKVESAVRKLNYVRDIHAANLSKSRTYPLLFILPQGNSMFMQDLASQVQQLQQQLEQARIVIEIIKIPPFDAPALVNALEAVKEPIAGVALVGTESPLVNLAIQRLAERGIPVVTLVSDLPNSQRIHYVGIDNVAAGRTAASLLGRFLQQQTGKIAMVVGSMLLRDHMERHLGFQQVLRTEFPHLAILPALEGKDEASTVAALLQNHLEQHRDIVGIYSLGAGNRGIIQALNASKRAGKIRVIVHDLTPHVRDALNAGMIDVVLHQDTGHEARSAVRVLKAHLDKEAFDKAQERIRIDIYLRDNLS